MKKSILFGHFHNLPFTLFAEDPRNSAGMMVRLTYNLLLRPHHRCENNRGSESVVKSSLIWSSFIPIPFAVILSTIGFISAVPILNFCKIFFKNFFIFLKIRKKSYHFCKQKDIYITFQENSNQIKSCQDDANHNIGPTLDHILFHPRT